MTNAVRPPEWPQEPEPRQRSSEGSPPSASEGVPIRDLVGALRRNVLLLALMPVALVALGVYLNPRAKPVYTASGAIEILNARRSVALGVEDQGSDRIARMMDPLQSQIEITKGRRVIGRAVDLAGLRLASLSPALPLRSLTQVRVDSAAAPDTLHLAFSPEGVTVRSRAGETHGAYGDVLVVSEGSKPDGEAGRRTSKKSRAARRSDTDRADAPRPVVAFAISDKPSADTATLVVRAREAAIDRISAGADAAARENTDILDVSFTSPDPVLAQRAANAVIEASRQVSIEMAQAKAARRRDFLAEQLGAADGHLKSAQLDLATFRARHHIYNTGDKLGRSQLSLTDVQGKLEDMKAESRMYRAMLADLDRAGANADASMVRALASSPGLGSSSVVSQLYAQLQRYETTLDSLTNGANGHTEGHPAVARVTGLIAVTRARLVDAARSYVASLDARAQALEGIQAQDMAKMQVLPEIEAEEYRLSQRVESIGGIVDNLRQELQKAEMAEAVEAGQVEVLYAAPEPGIPFVPGRRNKLALFGVVGLMLGMAGAFGREALNTSIRRREDVAGKLQLRELAVIPRQGTPLAPAGRRPAILPSLRATNGNGGRGMDVGTRSMGEEAFRSLRTNLMFSAPSHDVRQIVIASASPQEGKSTTAANLAVAFARQNMRVLLVDADLRRPSLHRMLNETQEPGLSSVLEGRDAPQRAIRKTPITGLFFLPSGRLPDAPTELLGGEPMRNLLASFEEEFDVTILDTPPLLVGADAAVLAAEAAGVLLLVRAGQTERGAAEHALRQLRTVGANVLGAVINDPDTQVAKYGEYYHYVDYSAAE